MGGAGQLRKPLFRCGSIGKSTDLEAVSVVVLAPEFKRHRHVLFVNIGCRIPAAVKPFLTAAAGIDHDSTETLVCRTE